ncbi:MAG: HAMP domain-containing histidine kinase, partial [Nonomuraea sp.]|nr:HAMP domain-containing histidine kinase [Nonomuraea sp.]
MRPLDFLGRIKVKLGIVIVLAVGTAFLVNELGIGAGWSRPVRIAVAVVLALVMVQVLAMGMTKPLREMARAAQTIAKGSYTLRVRSTSRDEVGELARAFNAMAADLGEVDRQRRELVANVSHELRTPIAGLRAVLENVVDGVSDADPTTMATALAQTERLGRLVTQLLDLSRLDSGARLIEPEAVEVAPLLEQAVREAALAREAVLLKPSVPAELEVRADPDLLAQVLANLLDNAVRHSPSGGVVSVIAAPAASGIRVVVADEGPGIPAAARSRVFERFSRLDSGRAADAGGAGLGLAIVKEVVELHGGSIRIDDGAGCRMVVDLPGRTTRMESPAEPPEQAPVEPVAESVPVAVAEVPAPAPMPVPAPAPVAGVGFGRLFLGAVVGFLSGFVVGLFAMMVVGMFLPGAGMIMVMFGSM